ncbi:MAG TPA: hypothetical protein VK489_13280 [Ferruginibacter sp.]|nr:hypothetical protein [Ferruginibacter sp.]
MIPSRILKKLIQFFARKNKAEKIADNISKIELWEEDYVVKKIQNQYKNVPEDTIRSAVKLCYTIYPSPQPGEKLMRCIIAKIEGQGMSSAKE